MPSEERKPTEGQRVCPKCGGEMAYGHDALGQAVVVCVDCGASRWCGHEEKVQPDTKGR